MGWWIFNFTKLLFFSYCFKIRSVYPCLSWLLFCVMNWCQKWLLSVSTCQLELANILSFLLFLCVSNMFWWQNPLVRFQNPQLKGSIKKTPASSINYVSVVSGEYQLEEHFSQWMVVMHKGLICPDSLLQASAIRNWICLFGSVMPKGSELVGEYVNKCSGICRVLWLLYHLAMLIKHITSESV